MNRSAVIFGAVLLGFLVYITLRGNLAAYTSLFWRKAAPKNNAGMGSMLSPENPLFNPGLPLQLPALPGLEPFMPKPEASNNFFGKSLLG